MQNYRPITLFVMAIIALGCGGDDDGSAGRGGSSAAVDSGSGHSGGSSGSDDGDGGPAGTGGSPAAIDGGDADGGDGNSDGGGPLSAQPQAGTITVNASAITGHQTGGYLVVVAVTPVGQSRSVLGSSCTAITADPFSVPDSVIQGLQPQDDSPCEPSGGDRVFDPGDYDVLFVVIKGGEQVPERSAKVTATVDGDITVTAPAYSDWRGPDADLQPGTITVNAAGITGHQNDGYILLIMATFPDQSHAALASSCAMITGDPFALAADDTVLQGLEQGDNPCEPSGGDKVFGGGDYDVRFTVIKAGEQVPERAVTVPVVVDGDTTVTAPDYGRWD